MNAATKIEDAEAQPGTPRFRLSAAIYAKDAAAVALKDASVAAIRASGHLRSAEDELGVRREAVKHLVDAQADALKQSIRMGQDLPPPPHDTDHARLALAKAEGHAEAARLAHSGLVNEEAIAATALETATQAVRQAANAVAAAEAEAIADQIEGLETEALRLKEKLGGPSGYLAQHFKPMPPSVRRVCAASSFMTNSPEAREAASWGDRWRNLLAELAEDADAQLN
jgi:hypothetical protein